MPEQDESVLPTLEDIERFAALEGFAEEDFATFEIPEFEARMSAIKANLTPKLTLLAETLAPHLSHVAETPLYPHVARHLRRSVNPPIETWCAVAKEKRAYKPYVHYRVGISKEKLRVTVFVEDFADEKLRFADNLTRNAETLASFFAHHPAILAYEMRDAGGEPLRGHALDAGTLRSFAEQMHRIKGQHAIFGMSFARTHPVVSSGPELMEALIKAIETLKPLYLCGNAENIDLPLASE